jgi:hypothetical protein
MIYFASRPKYLSSYLWDTTLAAYCATPQTTGRVHAADRRLVVQLYQRGVSLRAIDVDGGEKVGRFGG